MSLVLDMLLKNGLDCLSLPTLRQKSRLSFSQKRHERIQRGNRSFAIGDVFRVCFEKYNWCLMCRVQKWLRLCNKFNLVPRVSLLCLPWSLEERPWLQLVTWPPRIWVLKKSVGWEGWQSVLFVAKTNLVVSKPWSVAKNYLLYWGLKLNFANAECDTISAVFKM